jgi:hypothetical protein
MTEAFVLGGIYAASVRHAGRDVLDGVRELRLRGSP